MTSLSKNKRESYLNYSSEDETFLSDAGDVPPALHSQINISEFDIYKRELKCLINDQKFEDLDTSHLIKMQDILKHAHKKKSQESYKRKVFNIMGNVNSILHEIFK